MRRPQWLPARPDLPGLLLAAILGAVSLAIVRVLPSSPLISDILVALSLGAVLLNSPLRRLLRLELPSAEREPDRYAAGLRFTGKWVLRAAIVLMGLKVQTRFFGKVELLLILGVAAASLPSAFYVTHSLAALLGVRRPMADLIAGGTMICGASAVNAIAPLCGARREEQGISIGVIFLFSVVALVCFRPLADLCGLDPGWAGLWSGLAVNDLSSAVAVGGQMGGAGGVMAAASKSLRVLLLAPMLIVFSFLRREGAQWRNLRGSIVELLPRFLLGYLLLAVVRGLGDRVFGGSPGWSVVLAGDKLLVDFLLSTVAAGIGLHLALGTLLASGSRALLVGGGASVFMASLTLGMVVAASRGAHAGAALLGVGAVLGSYLGFRAVTGGQAELQRLRRRFDSGAPLSLGEATRLLQAAEGDAGLDDQLLKQLLVQLHPTIGELILVRESPLHHGEGCRWVTYWEGKSGWALVAVSREAGASTPIHAHPHRMLGKAIEGVLEELRFETVGEGAVDLRSREVLGHNVLIEAHGLDTLHVVRALGATAAIDLQLRGPEMGKPGRRMRTKEAVDFAVLPVGTRLSVTEEVDDRPGQGGEGASAGRRPEVPA